MKVSSTALYLTMLFVAAITLSSCNSDSKNSAVDSLDKKKQDSLLTVKTNHHWLGEWDRDDFQNEARISISKISGDSLSFSLDAASGGHAGQIEGRAFIQGIKAFFKSTDGDSKCSLVFTIKGDSIIMIDEKDCESQGGIGVYFSGKYVNSKFAAKSPNKKPAENLVSLEILTAAEDSVFRKLVGPKYEIFVNSTQLTNEDEKDMDNMHAKIRSSGVRGMFTYMENIVMVDSAKNICAAVLDDSKVYYFTNNKNYLYQLPKTIDDWRSRFNQYPVIYHSQK